MTRKKIPKPVRTLVWNKYIGEEKGIGKCNVCGEEIKVSNFECGHIISVADGGENIINNLVPICRSCNSSMGKENLNDYKERYFNDKSHVDIYVKCFLLKTDELVKVKGFMGYREYEYPSFLSFDSIYQSYKDWLYYNHIKYYEEIGMGNRFSMRYPDKNSLETACIKIYGNKVKNPNGTEEYGFINIKFK